MDNKSTKFKINGFTLIELIVVIAILGILTATLVPTMINIIEDSKKGVLETNCRGIVSFVQASSIKFDKEHLFLKS
jgi:prepilin-type N-terminal cleavage/methylation domain-containing protein